MLHVSRVGVHDDFFALGGHSLLATRTVNRIRAVLGVDVSVRELFEAPTVAGLAALVRRSSRATALAFERVDRTKPVIASFAQTRLWFLDQLEGPSATYNTPLVARLVGRLDERALERALEALVARHESLRTTFVELDGGAHQVILPASALPLTRYGAASEEDARTWIARELERPLDLRNGPVLRAALVGLPNGEHLLALTIHHIATDGWSTSILLRDLSRLYGAFLRGERDPLGPLAFDYADFAVWQRQWLSGDRIAEQVAFWRDHLAGAPHALELPTDRPRPAQKRYRGDQVPLRLTKETTEAVHALCRQTGATPFMVLMTVFQALLARWSGQSDVVVGTPIANRTRQELEGIVGFFVNTLAFRGSFPRGTTFVSALDRLRRNALAAYAHQDLPFEKLVDELGVPRDPSRNPVFQAMFVLQNGELSPLVLEGLQARFEAIGDPPEKFDLTLSFFEHEGAFHGGLMYDVSLFERSTMERFSAHFVTLLGAALASPATEIASLSLSDEEERRLLRTWSATAPLVDAPRTIHDLVHEQAAKSPQALAVADADGSLSYGEIASRSLALAEHLRARGVRRGDVVALLVPRSVGAVVAMLAVLELGAAYLALDPEQPEARLAQLLGDSHACAVIVAGAAGVPRSSATVVSLADVASSPSAGFIRTATSPCERAYVVYTSGSTGTPKGVVIAHETLAKMARTAAQLRNAGPGHRASQYASLGFDAHVWEIWPALVSGGSVHFAPSAARLDPEALVAWLARARIGWTFLPTPVAEQCFRVDWPPCELATLTVAGDALHAVPALRFPFALENYYGPSECTCVATGIAIEPGTERPSIGRPFPGVTVHVLDESLEPAPIGVVGEIHLGGDLVGEGYFERPELTAERFVPDPFALRRGARLYRTGDLARFRADGTLDFVGRVDHQVKVRGNRIELGEVEAAIRALPEVGDAIVVAHADSGGEKRLAAYVVAAEGADVSVDALRRRLGGALPEYMVPSAFVVLDALPLTPNGKVDRKALPVPDHASAAREYVAPRDLVEETLTSVFGEVLRVPRVGVHDDFFALGGHSLLATRTVNRIRAVLGVDLPVRALFEAPTPAGLAERARATTRSEATSLTRVERSKPVIASYSQTRLWFLDQLEGPSGTYNVPFVVRLTGSLDVPALERAVQALVARHEALRTTLAEVDGTAHQVIHAEISVPVARFDAKTEEAARTWIASEVGRPFTLGRAPLVRAGLVGLPNGEHLFALTVHHVATDGWSTGILLRDLSRLYDAFVRGESTPLSPSRLDYADFAAWQRQSLSPARIAEQVSFWKGHLAGAPHALELPTDHRRPAQKQYRGDVVGLRIPDATQEKLRALCSSAGVTPFMVLLTAFQALLARWSGQADVVVGTPIAGRTGEELEGIVGFFVNTLVFRNTFGEDTTFEGALERVRRSSLAAYAHQDLPFEKLVDELQVPRDTSRNPVFQAMFVLQNNDIAPLAFHGLSARFEPLGETPEKFDLTLTMGEHEGALAGLLSFDVALFEKATIERLASHFVTLLAGVVASPTTSIASLALMGETERRRVLVEWNATAHALPTQRLVHEQFEDRVDETPEAIALEMGERRLTYRELDDRANALAAELIARGTKPGAVVALCMERSVEMVIAIYGTLKAGGAYAPLDPEHPRDRLAMLVEDLSPAAVLVTERTRGLFADERVLVVDGAAAVSRTSRPGLAIHPETSAYVIYTSGSTGKPKGVVNAHRGILNRILWMQAEYRLGADDAVLQKTPYTFDVSVWEFLWPLMVGARLVLARPDGHKDPLYLAEVIAAHRVTTIHFVPSMLDVFLPAAEAAKLVSLRRVLCSGEALSYELTRRFFELASCELHNLYGPTEAAVDVTYWECRRDDVRDIVPIGRPIWNTQMYVVASDLSSVPQGLPGELCIGGVNLAHGYLRRPELTADRFVPDPFSSEPGARMYRTGDLARWLPDGSIQYLGRIDHQVKIRGLRIELGEIEATLLTCPGVGAAVVVAREDVPGNKRLVGYLVPATGQSIDVEALKPALARTLPEYMVPSAFVVLDAFPLTTSGKVDRKLLPAPDVTEASTEYVAPRTPIEQVLADAFAEVLRLPRVGIHDDFFALGGDSILTIRVVALARRADIHLTVKDVYGAPVVADLATRARTARIEAEQGLVAGELPLGPPYRWFLEQQPLEPNHFNQSMLLVLPSRVPVERLRRALDVIAEHHDALRLRVTKGDAGWRATFGELAGALPLVVHDLSGDTPAERTRSITELATAAQASLDLAAGPVARAVYFDLGSEEASRLFLVLHHFVVDGVSWRILLEDLHALLFTAPDAKLPEKTSSLKTWSERIVAFAGSDAAAGDLDFWLGQPWERAAEVPAARCRNGELAHHAVRLERETTSALLTRALSPYRLRVDEALVTGFCLALRTWNGGVTQAFHLEGHGRDQAFDDVDVSRTVGWFTAIYPVLVTLPDGSVRDALVASKEQLRAFTSRGPTFGLLRYLREPGDPRVARLKALPEPAVVFNYFGQQLTGNFASGPEPTGSPLSPNARATHAVTVNAIVVSGELVCQIAFDPQVVTLERTRDLAAAFLDSLREIVRHADEATAGALTPSDVRTIALDQPTLDRITTTAAGAPSAAIDLYRLSPLQHGLLFHHLSAPGDDPYVTQLALTFDSLDVPSLERALEALVERHDVFRTSLVWDDVPDPVQVIQRSARIELESFDWSSVPPDEVGSKLRTWMEENRRRGFDLTRAPLARASLFRVGGGYRLVWANHHVVVDGWSLGAILGDLFAFYRHFRDGVPLRMQPPPRYGTFVEWLAGQSSAASEAFYRRYLAGFEEPTLFDPPAEPSAEWTQVEKVLPRELSSGVRELARSLRVTLSTVLHAAWALVIGRYTGKRDVVFGSTTSGRAAPIPRIDAMVGLFINAVPARVRMGDEPVSAWLVELQEQWSELRSHEHLPLTDVQAWSEIPRGQPLFESLLTIENYHVDDAAKDVGTLGLRGQIEAHELTHYPVSLAVGPTEAINLVLTYDAVRFVDSPVRRALDHLERALQVFVEDRSIPVSRVSLLSDVERSRVLVEWNATARPVDGAAVHEDVARHARQQPHATAVVDDRGSLTYAQLDARANRLARLLQRHGVGWEDRVVTWFTRGTEMVVAAVAIMKAGAAYVPVDPAYPPDRIAYVVGDVGAKVVLSTRDVSVAEVPAPVIDLDDPAVELALGAESEEDLGLSVHDRQAAYAIYTSGTTGRPKGAVIEHRNLTNLVAEHVRLAELGPNDRVSQICGPAFDGSIDEIWPTLSAGAALYIVSDELRVSPDELLAWFARHEITAVAMPTALANTMLDADWTSTRVRFFAIGGEALRRRPRVGSPFTLLNAYGPTEATDYVTREAVEPGDHPITSIGRPVQNAAIYVLEDAVEPAPAGVHGEILIGGVPVGRGYFGRPELTAEKFVPDPFSSTPGARMYRTGDRGRWLDDGRLQFGGRYDDQVKIRGYRIEPGEIAVALRALPGVRDAIVLAREDARGEKRLAAYLVAPGASVPDLQKALAETLPEHMVPSAFVLLDAFPLTANGKVDRRALPAPDYAAAANEYVAPRTAHEEAVAAIFAEVLAVPRVGAHDDFFALGGHSLLAMRVVSRLRAAHGVEIPLKALFDAPTVADLATRVERAARGSDVAPIERADRTKPLPASFAQTRFWFLSNLDRQAATFNTVVGLRLRGPLHADALERSLYTIVARHEVLRTVIVEIGGEPYQQLDGGKPITVERSMASGATHGERLASARDIVQRATSTPLDLAHGPLMCAMLVTVDEGDHILGIAVHHAVFDGGSVAVFLGELASLYEAFREGKPSPLDELPIQYADYAAFERSWSTSPAGEEHLAYWRKNLTGAATLALPTDRPRPAFKGNNAGHVTFELSPELGDAIEQAARTLRASPAIVLLTAYYLVLGRWAQQDDVVVGTIVAGRDRPELEGLIGPFINNLALRTTLAGRPSFAELVGRVKETLLAGTAHQQVPFERVIDALNAPRDASRTPVFQVMFNYLQGGEELRLAGLDVEREGAGAGGWRFDLYLTVGRRIDGRVGGFVEFDADLFDGSTAARFLAHYQTVLEAGLRSPAEEISRLPLMSAAERDEVLREWNATAAPFPADRCLHELIEEQVRRAPDARALSYESASWTYAELNHRANRLARWLRAAGVGPNVFVGVYMERSLEMVASLVAILKAGGAYVPIDPEYPKDRVAYMLRDASTDVLLTQSRFAETVEHAGTLLAVDTAWDTLPADGSDLELLTRPSDLAYMIYTSGSTGNPKGARNAHSGIVNRLWWMQSEYRLDESDRVLQKTPFSFDVSVWEFFWPLFTGAELVVAKPGGHRDPAYLAELIVEKAITTIHFVPSMLRIFVSEPTSASCRSLRRVICSGEALPPDLAEEFLGRSSSELHNLYGPTECAVDVTYWQCERGAPTVPIGRPIANVAMYVLDEHLEPVPVGVIGEIFIGGVGVGLGYHRRPELTAEKFIPDPFSARPAARLYRTGDHGRFRADGALEYIGRMDGQVKVRGFRIELGEIEAALRACDGVNDVTVLVREDTPGDKRIVAYAVPAKGATLVAETLKGTIKEHLPEYMVPNAFVFLDALPLSPSGKVDRKALPAPDFAASAAAFVAPRTPLEETIAEIWRTVLRLDQVGVHDDFFSVGGTSLLVMKIVGRLREALDRSIPVRAVFDSSTIAQLAQKLSAADADTAAPPPLARTEAKSGEVLSDVQDVFLAFERTRPPSATWTTPSLLRLRGTLDRGALREAIRRFLARQDALRIVADFRTNAAPTLCAPEDIALEVVDMRGRTAAEVRTHCEERGSAGFESGPMIRFELIELGDDEHLLLLTYHQLVHDPTADNLLTSELLELYSAQVERRDARLRPIDVRYVDYALWRRRWYEQGAGRAEVEAARKRLAGARGIELPTDHPRRGRVSPACSTCYFPVDPATTDRFFELCQSTSVTPFMGFGVVTALFLARWSGQEDITFLSPVNTRGHYPEMQHVAGRFLNYTAISVSLGDDPTVAELFKRVRSATLSAYAYSLTPAPLVFDTPEIFDHPMLRVVLNTPEVSAPRPRASVTPARLGSIQPPQSTPVAPRTPKYGGLTVTAEHLPIPSGARNDVAIVLAGNEGGLFGAVRGATDLFEPATVRRKADELAATLHALHLDLRVSQLRTR